MNLVKVIKTWPDEISDENAKRFLESGLIESILPEPSSITTYKEPHKMEVVIGKKKYFINSKVLASYPRIGVMAKLSEAKKTYTKTTIKSLILHHFRQDNMLGYISQTDYVKPEPKQSIFDLSWFGDMFKCG